VIGVLASLASFALLAACLKRRECPGTVSMVSPPTSDAPFLHIVFDKAADASWVPLGRNRGYWIEGHPPEGLASAAVVGDRLVFRWERVEIPLLGWHADRLEYRLPKDRSRFSEESASRFWGPLVGICLVPLAVSGVVAAAAGGRR